MNLIFGTASIRGDSKLFQSFRRVSRELHAEPSSAAHPGATIQSGWLNDGGSVVGRYSEGSAEVLYMGPMHLPLPDHDGGSLLTRPAAALACERFGVS